MADKFVAMTLRITPSQKKLLVKKATKSGYSESQIIRNLIEENL